MATTKNTMTGIDGSKKEFSFTFPYLKTKDLKVELFHSTGGRKELDSTKFTFPTATSVSLSAIDPVTDWQELDGAPKVGVTGNVYRETSSDTLIATFYPGSAIRSGDLNDNYTQNLYTTQESTNDANDALDNSRVLVDGVYKSAIDRATEAETTADAADEIADEAKATADEAKEDADDAKLATDRLVATTTDDGATWTLAGNNTNASTDPKGVGWAVTKAEEALDAATDADNIADGAKEDADKALDATDTLVATKSGSTWTLQGGGTTAQDGSDPKGVKYAVETAEDAEDTADAAKLATDTYVHDGTSLKGDGIGSNPKGVKYAIDQVEKYVHDGTSVQGDGIGSNPKGVAYAITTAESAQASVAASAIYKLTSNLTSLTTDGSGAENFPLTSTADPSNAADDGTYVQITDSTGISLDDGTWSPSYFSGASSFPNGFDGHSQLTLRVKVSNSSAGSETYIAQEYYANDPEARYGEDRKVIVENNRTISANYTIQTTMNAHSVGTVTLEHNGTDLAYDASTYVVSNDATAGYTVTIPENSTWLIS